MEEIEKIEQKRAKEEAVLLILFSVLIALCLWSLRREKTVKNQREKIATNARESILGPSQEQVSQKGGKVAQNGSDEF